MIVNAATLTAALSLTAIHAFSPSAVRRTTTTWTLLSSSTYTDFETTETTESSSSSWESLAAEWAALHAASSPSSQMAFVTSAASATQAAAATAVQVAELSDQWQALQELNAAHSAYDDAVDFDVETTTDMDGNNNIAVLQDFKDITSSSSSATTIRKPRKVVHWVPQEDSEAAAALSSSWSKPTQEHTEIPTRRTKTTTTTKKPSAVSTASTTNTKKSSATPMPASFTSLAELAAEWTARNTDVNAVDKNNDRQFMTLAMAKHTPPAPLMGMPFSSQPHESVPRGTTSTTTVSDVATEWAAMTRPKTATTMQAAATPTTSDPAVDLAQAWAARNKEAIYASASVMPPPPMSTLPEPVIMYNDDVEPLEAGLLPGERQIDNGGGGNGYKYALPNDALIVPDTLAEEMAMLREVADADLFPGDKVYAKAGYDYNLVPPNEPRVLITNKADAVVSEIAVDDMNPGETVIDGVHQGYAYALETAQDFIVDASSSPATAEDNEEVVVAKKEPYFAHEASKKTTTSSNPSAAKWNRAVADAMSTEDFSLTMDFKDKDQEVAAKTTPKNKAAQDAYTRNVFGGAAAALMATFVGFATLSQPLYYGAGADQATTIADAAVQVPSDITAEATSSSEAEAFKPNLLGDQSL